jgi:hypothetical protein
VCFNLDLALATTIYIVGEANFKWRYAELFAEIERRRQAERRWARGLPLPYRQKRRSSSEAPEASPLIHKITKEQTPPLNRAASVALVQRIGTAASSIRSIQPASGAAVGRSDIEPSELTVLNFGPVRPGPYRPEFRGVGAVPSTLRSLRGGKRRASNARRAGRTSSLPAADTQLLPGSVARQAALHDSAVELRASEDLSSAPVSAVAARAAVPGMGASRRHVAAQVDSAASVMDLGPVASAVQPSSLPSTIGEKRGVGS